MIESVLGIRHFYFVWIHYASFNITFDHFLLILLHNSAHSEGIVTIPNHYVFSLIGYQPDTKMLQSIGIQIDSSTLIPTFNPDTYETNVKNVFLAGVVTGGIMNKVYIEDGRFHGLKIAEEIEQRLILF